MKSRTWLVWIVVAVVLGVVGVVLQVVLSPAAYDSVSNVGALLIVASIVLVVLLVAVAAGRKRQILRSLMKDHQGSLVQLTAVMNEEEVVTAGVVVDEEGLGFSSKEGSLRLVRWSSVKSLKTSNWRETIRTGLEISVNEEIIRLIPISSWTLSPVSERRSAAFFDAIRKAWRSHTTYPLAKPGP